MSLDKIEQVMSIIGQGVSLLTTLACLILAGFIGYVVLAMKELSGFPHIALTVVIALVGGLVLNLILRLLLNLSAY